MTIGKVSSYAAYINQVRTFTGTQGQINDLSAQLSSGKKSADLSFFGPDSQRLLDLKAEYARRAGFQSAIDNVQPRIKAYDKVLTRLNDIMTDLSSTTRLPPKPGEPTLSSVVNSSSGDLKISVDSIGSRFVTNATYTITSVPSKTGPAGSFDITINDGLGGKATNTINLKQIPPQIDADRFVMTGGPGDGAVLRIGFDQLKGAGTSQFTVDFPDVVAIRERVIGVMNEVQSLLNERVGDRYLFSGSRYDVKPVSDLVSSKQVSKLTLTGSVGKIGDTYEISVNGQRFTYQTTGAETQLSDIWNGTGAPPSRGLLVQMNEMIAQDTAAGVPPRLPLIPSVQGDVVTLIGTQVGGKFDVSSRIYQVGATQNFVNGAATPADPDYTTYPNKTALDGVYSKFTAQLSSPTLPQVDEVNLVGQDVDVGDVFTITVGNRRTIQVTQDEDPATPEVVYDKVDGPTVYSYVMHDGDIAAARAHPDGPMAYVAGRLAGLVNADPLRAADAAVVLPGGPPPFTTAQVQLTGGVGERFGTTAEVRNANDNNRLIANTLPPLSEPVVFEDIVREPDLPYFDSQFLTLNQSSKAFDKATFLADESLPVEYGVTTTDPGIQKLVSGLRRARAAVENPAAYEKLMGAARELLVQAKTEIRQVQSRVVNADATVQTAHDRHKQIMADVTSQIGGIEGIDQAEVAARLRQLLTTQEANYTVAGRIAQLSLVNFLA
ncbi:MAG TPA: hypothetical protein VED40_16565 [Azospirillaceae bacterium]|nr:hypothetical protein [Azospirillaceae bacterium]